MRFAPVLWAVVIVFLWVWLIGMIAMDAGAVT